MNTEAQNEGQNTPQWLDPAINDLARCCLSCEGPDYRAAHVINQTGGGKHYNKLSSTAKSDRAKAELAAEVVQMLYNENRPDGVLALAAAQLKRMNPKAKETPSGELIDREILQHLSPYLHDTALETDHLLRGWQKRATEGN